MKHNKNYTNEVTFFIDHVGPVMYIMPLMSKHVVVLFSYERACRLFESSMSFLDLCFHRCHRRRHHHYCCRDHQHNHTVIQPILCYYSNFDGLVGSIFSGVLDHPEQFLYELSQMSRFTERMECIVLRKRFNETLFNISKCQSATLVGDRFQNYLF